MKTKKIIPLIILPLCLLTSCNLDVDAPSNALVTAINYDGDGYRITYQMDDDYTTPDGKTKLAKGDYKPVHAAIQKRLGITLLEHEAAAVSGNKKSCDYFQNNWLLKPYADVAMGTVAMINNYSVATNAETILDLNPYMFDAKGNIIENTPLPNLAKFLYDHPTVKNSITTAKHKASKSSLPGAIYFIPYFDGFDDLEKMTMVREDYIRKVFDEFTNSKGEKVKTDYKEDKTVLGKGAKYEKKYTPVDIDGDNNAIERIIEVPNVDSEGKLKSEEKTVKLKKNKTNNIIYLQNQLLDVGGVSCKELVEQFKKYVNDRYGEPGKEESPFSEYSDLFLGYKACYDADEMVALMRIIKVSAKTLGLYSAAEPEKGKEMIPFLPRLLDNQRTCDIYRWAGQLFGVRGFESRNGYLYLAGKTDKEGFDPIDKVHDCRGDELTKDMIVKLQELYSEGLILQDFHSKSATGESEGKFAAQTVEGKGNKEYAGFMGYDYVKDQGEFNKQKDKEDAYKDDEMNYRPIVGGYATWDINGDGKKDSNDENSYVQFTESWRAVKTSAAVLRAGLVSNPEKLEAAFKYVDYAFSEAGKILYNFGPVENGYIKEGFCDPETGEPLPEEERDPESYITYQGVQIPKFSDKALEQANSLSAYQRCYVGATLPLGYLKLQGMEYQLTHEKTQKGIDVVNKAIELGTFKHVMTTSGVTETFYKIVPSSFFLTTGQASKISELLDKKKLGSIFTNSSSSDFNIWDQYVMGSKAQNAPKLEDYVTTVNGSWQLPKFVTYYQDAYEVMS